MGKYFYFSHYYSSLQIMSLYLIWFCVFCNKWLAELYNPQTSTDICSAAVYCTISLRSLSVLLDFRIVMIFTLFTTQLGQVWTPLDTCKSESQHLNLIVAELHSWAWNQQWTKQISPLELWTSLIPRQPRKRHLLIKIV